MADMICPYCWGTMHDVSAPNERCPSCHGQGTVPDEQLGPNFALSELLRSGTAQRKGMPNAPDAGQLANLRRLVLELLEPARILTGPLHIDSGLRLPPVNRAVGGSLTSAHCFGLAADCVPLAMSRRDMMDVLIRGAVKFDQLIWEGSWVHLAILSPRGEQRGQALMMFPHNGAPAYQPYDPADPRVSV